MPNRRVTRTEMKNWTIPMMSATVCEFAYIPTTWNNTSHLTRRLVFLLVILALTGGPTIYIAGHSVSKHAPGRHDEIGRAHV